MADLLDNSVLNLVIHANVASTYANTEMPKC